MFLFSNFVKVRTENLGSGMKSSEAHLTNFSAKELLSVPVRATKFCSGNEVGTRTCTCITLLLKIFRHSNLFDILSAENFPL